MKTCCGSAKMDQNEHRAESKIVKLVYQGVLPVSVFGNVTGANYVFDGKLTPVLVDERDAEHLLRNRMFRSHVDFP